MFNGHMDTSYSGREPWLAGMPGFQPEGFVKDGRIYGNGISNMKGALACYVEAVRSLQDAGVRLKGDVMIAAVCRRDREDAVGRRAGRGVPRLRRGVALPGRARRRRGRLHPRRADRGQDRASGISARSGCGSRRAATSSTRRSPRASATRTRSFACTTCSARCWSGSRRWEDDPENSYRGAKAIVNVSALSGGFGWRVSRTPHRADLFLDVRVPPTKADGGRTPGGAGRWCAALAERFPDYGVEGEVYVTAPGAEIEEDHPLVAAIDASHAEVFGSTPERDVTRWFSDASVLSRYGIATVNYGTSTGLPDTELGENLDIDGLVQDRRGLRAGAQRGLRMTVYELPAEPAGAGRRRRVPHHLDRDARAGADARVVGRAGRPRGVRRGARRALRLPAHGTSPDRDPARDLGRDPGRARLHAGVVRLPRPRARSCAGSGRRSRASPRRRSRSRSSSRSGSGSSTR